ncbi:hypothetical protein ACN6A9_02035 [Bacillus safensis]|nr:hypothetical protein [Bacillus pumilus]
MKLVTKITFTFVFVAALLLSQNANENISSKPIYQTKEIKVGM